MGRRKGQPHRLELSYSASFFSSVEEPSPFFFFALRADPFQAYAVYSPLQHFWCTLHADGPLGRYVALIHHDDARLLPFRIDFQISQIAHQSPMAAFFL